MNSNKNQTIYFVNLILISQFGEQFQKSLSVPIIYKKKKQYLHILVFSRLKMVNTTSRDSKQGFRSKKMCGSSI